MPAAASASAMAASPVKPVPTRRRNGQPRRGRVSRPARAPQRPPRRQPARSGRRWFRWRGRQRCRAPGPARRRRAGVGRGDPAGLGAQQEGGGDAGGHEDQAKADRRQHHAMAAAAGVSSIGSKIGSMPGAATDGGAARGAVGAGGQGRLLRRGLGRGFGAGRGGAAASGRGALRQGPDTAPARMRSFGSSSRPSCPGGLSRVPSTTDTPLPPANVAAPTRPMIGHRPRGSRRIKFARALRPALSPRSRRGTSR